jgi:OmpA-OmpF porin, OOP family
MKAALAAALLMMAPIAVSAGGLGPARGICIGTAEECSAAHILASAAIFDLMVNFELDSDRLSEQARANLLEFAKELDDPRLANVTIAVEGHTDAIGPESYNQDLSERRAHAVVEFLRERGADVSRFVVRGYGESRPRTDDPYDPVNRRVETRIVQ